MNNTSKGNQGEDLAVEFLEKKNYQILERNFRIRGGEVDIVARDQECLVFIEVKMRNSHEFGLPEEAITPQKIHLLKRTALFYCTQHKWNNRPYRIDALAIDASNSFFGPVISHFKNITG